MENFTSPKSVNALCEALKNRDKNTYVIAGGTNLVINFIRKGILDYNIIDLTKLEELKEINETDKEITIGACVTITEIENSPLLIKYIPALIDAAYNLGSQQIRNKATIGGNVANSSQIADTLPVLFAYDANIEIINSLGMRRIDKLGAKRIVGLGKNNLNFDEIITKIIIKKSNSKSAFSKVGSRKAATISKVNCCIKIDMNDDMVIEESIIYLGALCPKPIRAKLIEEKILFKNINNIKPKDIQEAVYLQIENIIPNRSSKHYIKVAAEGLVEDIFDKLRR